MEKGNKIADFKGKKYPYYKYFLRSFPGILISSFLVWAEIDSYLKSEPFIPELLVCTVGVTILTIWMIYSNFRHSFRIALTAYENGIDVPKLGFFRWDELRVSQQKYLKQAPSISFIPCYFIRLGYDKQTAIFQYLEDYTGLYHLLYSKGVPGAERDLLIYNTTIDGVKIEIKPVYSAIFNPRKNELRHEKGNPFEWQG